VSGLLDTGGYVVVAILVVVGLLASVDAARRPQAAWHAVGARKWLWVIGMLVGTYFVAGVILVILYLGGVRKDLQAVEVATGG
jgi:hypothetical protein